MLRWWRRDVLDLTQQEAAARLNVQSSALSNWERNTRAISLDLDELDHALEGGRFLAGLLHSFGTCEGLQPGRVWTNVFADAGEPVWLWLRADASSIAIEAEWGVAAMETELPLGPNGAFITVGSSMADSPVVVQFSAPAWADFGYGDPPDPIPGASVAPAVAYFRRSSATGPFMQLFRSNWSSKLDGGSPDVVELEENLPGSLGAFVDGRPATGETLPGGRFRRWQPRPEGLDAMERARFARLRTARQLSLEQVAELLAARTDIEVRRDTLRRFENDIGRPHHPQLPAALDHVLRAGGRLALVGIRSGSGSAAVRLPPYWRGPVWVELAARPRASTVLFRRGSWHRSYELSPEPALLGLHWFDPAEPLRIEADGDVAWTVGVGRRADTETIDQNWSPSSVDEARNAVDSTEAAIMEAARHQARRQLRRTDGG